jgi:DNA-binding CsgD family transcriptional regulator
MVGCSIIPTRVLYSGGLTPTEKIFAGIILGEIIQKGKFSLSNKEIANVLEISEGGVRNMLSKLYQKRVIKKSESNGTRMLLVISDEEDLQALGCHQMITAEAELSSNDYSLGLNCNRTITPKNATGETRVIGNTYVRTEKLNTLDLRSQDSPNLSSNLESTEREIKCEKERKQLLFIPESENKPETEFDVFERLWKQYPKKEGKKWAIKKFARLKLKKKEAQIANAINNYKMSDKVINGFVYDFTKFLEIYEEYVDGLPEGVKVGNAEKAENPNRASVQETEAFIGKLEQISNLVLSAENRLHYATMSASELRAKGGAALFNAKEAAAVELLGGIEQVVVALKYQDGYTDTLSQALQRGQI